MLNKFRSGMSYNAVNCKFNVNESIGILKEVFFFFFNTNVGKTRLWIAQ